MNKDSYYFSHDCNARNDQRMVKVRMNHGYEGYGIYFAIVEMLREAADYTLKLSDLPSIAYELRVDLALVEIIVGNYDLFIISDDTFYSNSLKRRMQEMDNKRKIRAKAGQKGGLASAKAKQKTTIAKAVKKVNNIKEKENKKSLESIDPVYLEELQDSHKNIDVSFQLIKFKDWVQANGKKYKDYRAAFRNWLKSPYIETTNKIINENHKKLQKKERLEIEKIVNNEEIIASDAEKRAILSIDKLQRKYKV